MSVCDLVWIQCRLTGLFTVSVCDLVMGTNLTLTLNPKIRNESKLNEDLKMV